MLYIICAYALLGKAKRIEHPDREGVFQNSISKNRKMEIYNSCRAECMLVWNHWFGLLGNAVIVFDKTLLFS